MLDPFREEEILQRGEACSWGRRVLLKLETRRPRRTQVWLAKELHIGTTTLRDALSGKTRPPIGLVGSFASALGMDASETRELFKEMVSYHTVVSLESTLGTFDQREREITDAFASELSDYLIRRWTRAPAILWLPFVLHELPFSIKAGRVVMTEASAKEITFPPQFIAPTAGMPQLLHQPRGQLLGPLIVQMWPEMFIHAAEENEPWAVDLISDFVFHVAHQPGDRIVRHSAEDIVNQMHQLGAAEIDSDTIERASGLYYQRMETVPCVLYAGTFGEPVNAIYGGVVASVKRNHYFTATATDGWNGLEVRVNLQNGYVVEYANLSDVFVSVGDEIVQGESIGLTGKHSSQTKVVIKSSGEIVHERTGVSINGVCIYLLLDDSGYESLWGVDVFLDPNILVAQSSLSTSRTVDVRMMDFWDKAELNLFLREELEPVSLWDLARDHVGQNLWLRRPDTPYVVVSDNHLLADMAVALLFLLQAPYWLHRFLRHRDGKGH